MLDKQYMRGQMPSWLANALRRKGNFALIFYRLQLDELNYLGNSSSRQYIEHHVNMVDLNTEFDYPDTGIEVWNTR